MTTKYSRPIFATLSETNVLLNNDSVAQLVEQLPFKQWVDGSSPSGVTSFSLPKFSEIPPPKMNSVVAQVVELVDTHV